MRALGRIALAVAIVWLAPAAAYGAYHAARGWAPNWRVADWSSARLLAPPASIPEARVMVFCAPAARWKGILASHCWLVLKPAGGARWRRYEVVGWGRPVRRDAYAADARWYGFTPERIGEARGALAAAAIPKLEAAIQSYPYGRRGHYRAWPGPNSNSFIAHLLRHAPELRIALPPRAVGKDFPLEVSHFAAPSGTGWSVSAGGYAGVTLALEEGFEVNLLGLVAGIDVTRPAIKLPGIGRVGLAR